MMQAKKTGTRAAVTDIAGKHLTQPSAPGQSADLARKPRADVPGRADVGVITSLKKIGFNDAEIHKLVVSKRSLERRYENREPLSPSETDRAHRIARIFEHAVRVFASEDKAHRWLRKPCRALDGVMPLDLLASETGAHIVDSELHAIDHGMFA